MLRVLLQTVVPLAAAVSALGAVAAAGRYATAALQARDACSIRFAAIECTPPPGQTRVEFLDEVQYLGDLPDRLRLLQPGLPARLAAGFSRHPWVSQVERVTISPGRWVRVELMYRRAALAVRLRHPAGGSGDGPAAVTSDAGNTIAVRVVDDGGVLLPGSASATGLPVLDGEDRDPSGPPGTPWGSEHVRAAAALAAFLGPDLARLRLSEAALQVVGSDLVVRGARVRILWGRPPGHEAAAEPSASVKRARLLEFAAGRELADSELDLRTSTGPRHTSLPGTDHP
jgi:hypothetical protein